MSSFSKIKRINSMLVLRKKVTNCNLEPKRIKAFQVSAIAHKKKEKQGKVSRII